MDNRSVDPRALRAFVAVAREGNVSRAAQTLHLSQPAVSLQLKQLSAAVGLTLFDRTPHGVVLTRDGAALLPQAERSLAALAEFGQVAQRLVGSVRGVLRIGTILDPPFTRLGAFLNELSNLAPEVEPDLLQGMSGDVRDGVAEGRLDLGWFIGEPNPSDPGGPFHVETLAPFTYRVVAPAGWGPQVLGRDWAALSRLPWILTPPASAHARLLAAVLNPLGLTQSHRVACVDQEESMLALVRSGVGLSLLRDSVARRESHSAGLVIADQVGIETSLSVISLARQRNTPLLRCAHEAMARAWGLTVSK